MIVAEFKDSTIGMLEQFAYAATRSWFMASTDLALYADVLVTLRNGRVGGAFQVASHQHEHRPRAFQLEVSSRLAFLIRQPAPFGGLRRPGLCPVYQLR